MKHIKIFEQFIKETPKDEHRHTGREYAEKMRIYAEASDVPTVVTPIKKEEGSFTFSIATDIPGFFTDKGKTTYKVVVPEICIEKVPYVITMEDGEETLKTSLEISGENKMNILLYNFIEATNLYDDHFITAIVNRNHSALTSEDIRKFVKELGTEGIEPDH